CYQARVSGCVTCSRVIVCPCGVGVVRRDAPTATDVRGPHGRVTGGTPPPGARPGSPAARTPARDHQQHRTPAGSTAPNTGRQHRNTGRPHRRSTDHRQHRSPAAPRTSRESREGTARNPMSTDQVYVMPASPSQLGLWLLSELEPTSSAYHVPLAVRLTGPLDPAALEEAVRLLGERHEILRTTFGTADGEVSQFIHPAPAWRMEHVALDHLTPEAAEEACRDHSAARAFAPFDLAAGPLLRPVLYRLADDA